VIFIYISFSNGYGEYLTIYKEKQYLRTQYISRHTVSAIPNDESKIVSNLSGKWVRSTFLPYSMNKSPTFFTNVSPYHTAGT
jgi:hypothetical protein